MKFKVSKKSFKDQRVYRIGYCKLQWLLCNADPIAYSSGIYGWSCDYYQFGDIYISTGYSPIGKKVDDKIVKHFDELARKTHQYTTAYDFVKGMKQREILLKKFINKITQE